MDRVGVSTGRDVGGWLREHQILEFGSLAQYPETDAARGVAVIDSVKLGEVGFDDRVIIDPCLKMVVDDPHSEMEPSVCGDGGRTCGNGSPVMIGSTPDELVFFCMHPDVIAPIAIERLVNVGGSKK